MACKFVTVLQDISNISVHYIQPCNTGVNGDWVVHYKETNKPSICAVYTTTRDVVIEHVVIVYFSFLSNGHLGLYQTGLKRVERAVDHSPS